MRTKDPEKHRAKRQKIITAAARIFAKKGFDAATTAEISREAEISTGNLFHYFSNKREIFFAVIIQGEHEKAEKLADALNSQNPLKALFDVVALLTEPAAEPLGPPLVMEAMLQAQRDPKLAEWLNRGEADEQTVIETLVNQASSAGQIDPGLNARDTASWIMGLIGALYLMGATNPAFRPETEIPVFQHILRRFLKADL